MATRAIITHHPEVECDVCGRRLLRGERPDAFIDSGHRRIVCELCAPRAVGSGWTREADALAAAQAAPRGRGGRSLMGRFRTRRVPERERDETRETGATDPDREPIALQGDRETPRGSGRGRRGGERRPQPAVEPYDLDDDLGLSYEDAYRGGAEALPRREDAPAPAEDGEPGMHQDADAVLPSLESGAMAEHELGVSGADETRLTGAAEDRSEHGEQPRNGVTPHDDGGLQTGFEIASETALTHFNGSEAASRVAGIARALGEPEVTVRPLDDEAQRISIVVAWELCWYRYEVDIGAESPLVTLSGDGTELHELPAEDRAGNAQADERGELSLT